MSAGTTGEIARIVCLVSRMEPPEAEQAAAMAIDRLVEPLADLQDSSNVLARHMLGQVRRLRTH